jgi:peptide deformylase
MSPSVRCKSHTIFQHEYDHLDGTVYIDRLSEDGRSTVQPRLDELVEDFGDGGAL